MIVQRRELLKTLAAASILPAMGRLPSAPRMARTVAKGRSVDWTAGRQLFPLAPDWTHLSSFLFVSHPKPVADAIDYFRRKLDSDPTWIEQAAFTDAEGRPYQAVKRSIADYI